MFDNFMYKILGAIDDFFIAIEEAYERLKNNRIFSSKKRKRGEKMRKKGDKGAPTAKAIKRSQA